MDRRSIVLTSISCRGVKSFINLFQKPSIYTTVSIAAGDNERRKRNRQKQKTSADHDGGENPEWDQTIQFDLNDGDLENLFLEFAILAQGNRLLFGDKLIGKSRVPLLDLGHPSDLVRHVSYQIRSPEGKPNGILSFSYILNLPAMEIRMPTPLDPGIPPAPQRRSLYPLLLPDAEPDDCFCSRNPSPPPVPIGYHGGFDRASTTSQVLNRDAYFSVPVVGNRGYYTPPASAITTPMPEFGRNYGSSAPGYICPPPQGSYDYWNCKRIIKEVDDSNIAFQTQHKF